jgi:hypothetical protein
LKGEIIEHLVLLLNLLEQQMLMMHYLLEQLKVWLFVDQMKLHQLFYEWLMDVVVLLLVVLLIVMDLLLLMH